MRTNSSKINPQIYIYFSNNDILYKKNKKSIVRCRLSVDFLISLHYG